MERQKEKKHSWIYSLLVSMAILTVSSKLKVYSQTNLLSNTLTYVIPPKGNTADQAENENEHQFF